MKREEHEVLHKEKRAPGTHEKMGGGPFGVGRGLEGGGAWAGRRRRWGRCLRQDGDVAPPPAVARDPNVGGGGGAGP